MTGRQRIGSRYISRRKDGTISKNVDVGRSLSADRRTNAKKTVKAGYGDKGDIKRAEESDLSMTLANMERELGIDSEDYEDYGKYTNPTARLNAAISKIEREFDVNEKDFQHRGLKKDAESFGAEGECGSCGLRQASLSKKSFGYSGVCRDCGWSDDKSAESFDAESELPAWPSEAKKEFTQEERDEYDEDRIGPIYEINGEWTWCNTGSGRAGHLELGDSPLCGYCGTNYASESFGAESMRMDIMSKCPECQSNNMEHFVTDMCKNCEAVFQAESFSAERRRENWFNTNHQNFSESKRKLRSNPMMQSMKCVECGDRMSCLGPYTNNGERSSASNDFYAVWCRGCADNSNSAEEFGAESFGAERECMICRHYGDNKDFCKGCGNCGASDCCRCVGSSDWEEMQREFPDVPYGAESFKADIVQDVKDFDVVGTTQKIVGKTGFKVPTGVASIAILWVAYMTGKKYGN